MALTKVSPEILDLNNTAGTSNVRLGVNAGNSIESGGNYNVVVGDEAGTAITTGDNNVAVGYQSLDANTTGSRLTAVGNKALSANITAAFNVAVGDRALLTNTGSSNNVAVGANALYTFNVGSGDGYNVAVGKNAGLSVTTGHTNTLIGGLAGDAITTGSGNTFIGFESGSYGTNLTTGTTNTLVGAYNNTTAVNSVNAMGLGYNLDCAGGYTTVGSGSAEIRAPHGSAAWATASDQRYKKDIVDSTAGLSFINALQPRTFKYKTLGELPETFSAYEADSTEVFKNSETNHGFIAQEVKAAIDADASIKDGFRLWDDREDGSQEVAEAALIPVLVKAIQEQNALITALTARVAELEG